MPWWRPPRPLFISGDPHSYSHPSSRGISQMSNTLKLATTLSVRSTKQRCKSTRRQRDRSRSMCGGIWTIRHDAELEGAGERHTTLSIRPYYPLTLTTKLKTSSTGPGITRRSWGELCLPWRLRLWFCACYRIAWSAIWLVHCRSPSLVW